MQNAINTFNLTLSIIFSILKLLWSDLYNGEYDKKSRKQTTARKRTSIITATTMEI